MIVKAVLGLIVLALPTATLAQIAPPSTVEFVTQEPQLLLPNAGPRGELSYQINAVILTTPLAWRIAGVLQGSAKVQIGDDADLIASGTPLRPTTLRDPRSKVPVAAFCEGRPLAESYLGQESAISSIARSVGLKSGSRDPDSRFCLIDLDGDGTAEHSVYLDRSSSANIVGPTRPVRILSGPGVPLPKTQYRATWTLSDVAADGSSIAVKLDFLERGNWRTFEQIAHTPRISRIIVKDRTLPLRVTVFGADFDVVKVDGAARTATIRWPGDADAARVVTLGSEVEERPVF